MSAAWDCWLRIFASILYTWRSSAPSEVIKGPIKTAYKELNLEFSNSNSLVPKLSYTVLKLGKSRRHVVRRVAVSTKSLLRPGRQFVVCFVSRTFVECLETTGSLRSLAKRRRPEHFLTNMHSSGWRTYLCLALQLWDFILKLCDVTLTALENNLIFVLIFDVSPSFSFSVTNFTLFYMLGLLHFSPPHRTGTYPRNHTFIHVECEVFGSCSTSSFLCSTVNWSHTAAALFPGKKKCNVQWTRNRLGGSCNTPGHASTYSRLSGWRKAGSPEMCSQSIRLTGSRNTIDLLNV
jgi:hypothetical protein